MSLNYDESIYNSLLPLIILLESVMILFTYFSLTWSKRVKSEETQSRVHKSFIGIFLIEFWYWFTSPVLNMCKIIKVTPNQVTVFSLFLSLITGYIYSIGYIAGGGFLLIFSGSLDLIDGRLARETGQSTRAGAFLDSCLDRYSDAFVLIGIAIYYLTKNMDLSSHSATISLYDLTVPLLIMVLLLGTASMSYVKARGEAVGITTKKGLMQRPERITLLGVYSVLDPFIRIILSRYGILEDMGMITLLALMTLLVNSSAMSRLKDIFGRLQKEN